MPQNFTPLLYGEIILSLQDSGHGVGGGRKVQEGGNMYYQGLIRVDVHRKPAGHCKAIILQLKVNKFLKAPLQKKKH